MHIAHMPFFLHTQIKKGSNAVRLQAAAVFRIQQQHYPIATSKMQELKKWWVISIPKLAKSRPLRCQQRRQNCSKVKQSSLRPF